MKKWIKLIRNADHKVFGVKVGSVVIEHLFDGTGSGKKFWQINFSDFRLIWNSRTGFDTPRRLGGYCGFTVAGLWFRKNHQHHWVVSR